MTDLAHPGGGAPPFQPALSVKVLLPVTLLLAVAPGYLRLPVQAALLAWGISLSCLGIAIFGFWRAAHRGKNPLARREVRMGMLVLAALLVAVTRQDLPLLDLGSGFLGVILFIKLLELESPRAVRQLLLVSLLPALAECYHDQSPLVGLRLFVVVLLVIVTLIALTSTPVDDRFSASVDASVDVPMRRPVTAGITPSRLAGRAGVLILQALPVALALFLLLPRLQYGEAMPASLRQALYGMDGPNFGGGDFGTLGLGRLRRFGGGSYLQEEGWLSRLFDQMQTWFDHTWDAFLNYGFHHQQELWISFGLPPAMPWWLGFVVLGVVILFLLALVYGWLLFERWRQEDPVLRFYRHYCLQLARLGTIRLPHEGPVDFSRRAAERHPTLAVPIGEIGRLYGDLRYGRAAADALPRLRRMVNDLRWHYDDVDSSSVAFRPDPGVPVEKPTRDDSRRRE
ncbi:MAG: DUF3488 domain-containing protein [Magnetococcales bacterium]|nr:DUF3488 domain-containing protein [Magnetococcales bacterium]